MTEVETRERTEGDIFPISGFWWELCDFCGGVLGFKEGLSLGILGVLETGYGGAKSGSGMDRSRS